VHGEIQHAKLVRAVVSERQLNEVMVDFWSNHFNVDMRKNACRALIVAHDRDAVRPHALGRFRDLLGAVARSPAMLAYLDNNENSVARERSVVEQRLIEWAIGYKFGMSVAGQLPRTEGPNENFGRELLELHTLGVDGGYAQQDVQAVARCFSGWTYSPLGGKFDFTKNRHDQGAKTCSATRSRPAAGSRTASGCSTCWPPTRRRPGSSAASCASGSWPTTRRPRSWTGSRRCSPTPAATSARSSRRS
jgi:uncharacterized protein (DUF1800 family)